MKKFIFLLTAIMLTTTTMGCTKAQQQAPQQPPLNQTKEKNQPPQETQIKLYLIALDDAGKSGKNIGTGDSVVSVKKTIPASQSPLQDAFKELLSLKNQYYGQSGLYNALYRSNLKLEKASITQGTAKVYLSGSLSLGGVLDNPRVESQLQETALQFPTVNKVQIYVNNQPLKETLSLK